MAKRGNEPEEAIGPQLDGLRDIPAMNAERGLAEYGGDGGTLDIDLPMPLEEPEESLPAPLDEDIVILVFGDCPEAWALARLAVDCGFAVEAATDTAEPEFQANFPQDTQIHVVPDYLDIVDTCGIDRNFFVCVFMDNLEDCETILAQCLASPAAYLGVAATYEQKKELYDMLKEDGAPDAELAAVCCPMGLPVGADNPEQAAVGIMAEMLAARGGTLARLRQSE